MRGSNCFSSAPLEQYSHSQVDVISRVVRVRDCKRSQATVLHREEQIRASVIDEVHEFTAISRYLRIEIARAAREGLYVVGERVVLSERRIELELLHWLKLQLRPTAHII